MTEDILELAKAWVSECGSCDYGLPAKCQCPTTGGYRPIISELMREVERLRVEVGVAADSVECPGCDGRGVTLPRPDEDLLVCDRCAGTGKVDLQRHSLRAIT